MALDKVIDSAELDANLTAVADAIRTKGGTSEALSFPGGFISAVEGIQTGGGGDVDPNAVARSIVDRTIVEYKDNELNKIGSYVFRDCTSIVTADLPSVTRIASNCFYGCKNLETVKLPNLKTTYGVDNAFNGCTSLKNVDLSSVICLGGNFNGCTSLEEISFPSIGTSELAVTGGGLYGNVFLNCTALKKVDFGNSAPFLRTYAFRYCASLKTVIIRGATVAKLSNVNNFDGTPFASGGTGGTVYVPSALITQYQQATNWSTLYAAGTCNFVAIEGSEYE